MGETVVEHILETHKNHGFDVNAARSIEMLKAVIEGRTYDAVAVDHGITRTAVERRVKGIATRLSAEVGIAGLNEGGAAFVRRLRHKRAAILAALERFEPKPSCGTRQARVVSAAEIDQAVHRIRGRSAQPARDIALFFMLFATGARPLEIARIEVRDYLHADGTFAQAFTVAKMTDFNAYVFKPPFAHT